MKIESVRIKNFRSFKDETIPFNDYTCLVGPNGAGKSTVLTALNVFFRESENVQTNLNQLDEEDFHQKNTADPIHITVTFTNLSEEAQKDFADYFRQDKLVVSAVAEFNADTGKAEVKQYGQRSGMLAFAPFFKASSDGKKVAELKDIYTNLRNEFSDLPPPGTKNNMEIALHHYENEHPKQCVLIPSEDQFYGFSKGGDRLAKHVQWVYVPAVKDVTSEQVEARNSALGKLLARTVRSKANFDETVNTLRSEVQDQYQDLLDQNQYVLEEISKNLEIRLSEWAHPDARIRLQWKQDPEKSIKVEEPWAHILAGEGGFEGELARFGHGLQRSYLLALLQELAGANTAGAPALILACEEPELYQHPPQARHLAGVLDNLSRENTQVLVSTHNPLFVSGEGFEDVRMVRKNSGRPNSSVSHMSFEEIAKAVGEATGNNHIKPAGALAKIHQVLQPSLNEMFFTQHLVLVEGLEDAAYLLAYFSLQEQLEDYRRMGCHIVPVNRKSELLQPLVIAKHMGIPTYVVFDADTDQRDRNGSRIKNEKDNQALLNLLVAESENPMPTTPIWGKGFTIWNSNIGAIIEADIGEDNWKLCQNEADKLYGHAGGLKKNTLHIGASLAFAWDKGLRSLNLERLCGEILKEDNRVPPKLLVHELTTMK